MDLTIASWNVAGANLLTTPPPDRAAKRQQYNEELCALIKIHQPDVIVLQETVRYEIEKGPAKGRKEDLFSEPDG